MNIHIRAMLGTAGGCVTLLAYIAYAISIVRRKTKPHRVTWTMYFLISVVSLESQHKLHATWSIALTAAQVLGAGGIMLLSFYYGEGAIKICGFKIGRGENSRANNYVILAVATALVFRGLTNDYDLVILWTIIADTIATIPTCIKVYHDPHKEAPLPWAQDGLAAILGTAAAGTKTFGLIAFPIYLIAVNFGMPSWIFARRRKVRLQQQA